MRAGRAHAALLFQGRGQEDARLAASLASVTRMWQYRAIVCARRARVFLKRVGCGAFRRRDAVMGPLGDHSCGLLAERVQDSIKRG